MVGLDLETVSFISIQFTAFDLELTPLKVSSRGLDRCAIEMSSPYATNIH